MCLCRQVGVMLPVVMLRPGSELLAMTPSVLHAACPMLLTQHLPLLGVSWLTPAHCMGCMGWLAARPRGVLLISMPCTPVRLPSPQLGAQTTQILSVVALILRAA